MRFAARSLGKQAVADAVTKVLQRRRDLIPPHDDHGALAQPAPGPTLRFLEVTINQDLTSTNGGAVSADLEAPPSTNFTGADVTGGGGLDYGRQADWTVTINGGASIPFDAAATIWPSGTPGYSIGSPHVSVADQVWFRGPFTTGDVIRIDQP